MQIRTSCKRLLRAEANRCPDDGAAAATVWTLPKNTRLGANRIDRMLGEGGTGFVYEATHEVLNRRSAIKMPRPEFASQVHIVARFLNEAKAVNLIDHQNIVNVSEYGSVMGTPQYMSLEQITGEAVNVRSDVWAMGVMLYRAATGQAPFKGEEFAELVDEILHHVPQPASESVALPAALSVLIASCVQRRPEDRYPSVTELLAALERVKWECKLDKEAILAAVIADAGERAQLACRRGPIRHARASPTRFYDTRALTACVCPRRPRDLRRDPGAGGTRAWLWPSACSVPWALFAWPGEEVKAAVASAPGLQASRPRHDRSRRCLPPERWPGGRALA